MEIKPQEEEVPNEEENEEEEEDGDSFLSIQGIYLQGGPHKIGQHFRPITANVK